MAAFEYKALDQNGRQKKGVLEGDSARQIRQMLKEKSWIPLEVEQTIQKEKKAALNKDFFNFGPRPISAKELALVTRQLSTLVQAGMAVEEALRVVSRQSRNARVNAMMLAVRSKVVEGHSLAVALEEFPSSFPEIYRATVAAGEHSGHLDLVLNRLADYTEEKEETQGEIKKAMIQPILLMLVSVGVLILLLNNVVPKLVSIFDSEGAVLPLPTRVLLGISEFTQTYAIFVVIGIVFLFLALRFQMNREVKFKEKVHAFYLRVPLFSQFFLGNDLERFTSTLSILSRSGVPLVEAIKISGDVSSNLLIRYAIKDAGVMVSEGGSLSRALQKSEYFPPMLIQMIASGESSGELDEMLGRAAKNQQRELSSLISNVLALFGPIMTIVMAGLVMAIVLAIMLPIIELNNLIAQ